MYDVTHPVRAVTISEDDTPASKQASDGLLLEVAKDQAVIELLPLRISTKRLLLGVEGRNGDYSFTTFELTKQTEVGSVFRLEGNFARDDRDILRSDNLTPQLNQETHRFESGLPSTVLEQWVDLDVLRPRLLDRVYSCPACAAILSVRQGCRGCGSVRTTNARMVHHFACAYVGPVAEYERTGELACPKCLTRNLVVGTDFEFFNGLCQCEDCEWTDTQLSMVGECLACNLRLPIELAHEQDLIVYDVDRLDPLAVIDLA
jgi:hypothetical protein